MSKLILHQILSGKPEPFQKSLPRKPFKNPFLQGYGLNAGAPSDQGVNQPLRHPMFVGYRDNKPIYAGSRLFVLY